MSFELEKRVSSKKSECRRSKKVSFEEEDVFILKPTLIINALELIYFYSEREKEREREREIRVMNRNLATILTVTF